jgi:signal peptidase I
LSDADMKISARRPWIAFSLSLLLSGLGQLYCGRVRAALLFMGLELLSYLALVAITTTLWPSPHLLLITALFMVGALAIKLACLIDVVIGAKRARSFTPAWFNRWYVYVLLFAGFVVAGGLVDWPVHKSVRSFRIPSASMSPTVRPGDRVMAGLLTYHQQSPKRCDIVIFTDPSPSDSEVIVSFIKRVVATAGDEIQYRNGKLYLNGTMVPRELVSTDSAGTVYRETMPDGCSYEVLEQSDQGPLDSTPLYRVPAGTVFVLGDNRDESADSRVPAIGFVPLAQISGRALYIYWARDLSRIGMLQN